MITKKMMWQTILTILKTTIYMAIFFCYKFNKSSSLKVALVFFFFFCKSLIYNKEQNYNKHKTSIILIQFQIVLTYVTYDCRLKKRKIIATFFLHCLCHKYADASNTSQFKIFVFKIHHDFIFSWAEKLMHDHDCQTTGDLFYVVWIWIENIDHWYCLSHLHRSNYNYMY